DVSGRGKLGADMREIWMMQPRFDKRTGNGPFTLVEQPRFRAAFDFLRLRAQVGEVDEELAHWWETFSQAGEAVRRDMIEAVRLEQQRARSGKARRARGDPAADAHAGLLEPGVADGLAGTAGEAPARKRRRRRRKPRGDSGGEGPCTPDAGASHDDAP
ncbi:MAG: polynucleotide adenylyltransferase PcnB, partial [Tepidimonas sp.]|nr:polynucleotide adenylyltransferase PcnB [Tepidimonas sp.]